MKRFLPLLALSLAAGCRGTIPDRYGSSSLGFSAVLIGARIIVPTGEIKDGALAVNLESGDEHYRLGLIPGETSLFRVEPGLYRVYPTRNIFGFIQPQLRVRISGRTYRVPFPRDILRMDAVEIKPTKAVALGVLEARLTAPVKGQARRVEVRLDASTSARRHLVEDVINKMLDPKISLDVRESSVSWTRALEQCLVRIQGEEQKNPSYKPSK